MQTSLIGIEPEIWHARQACLTLQYAEGYQIIGRFVRVKPEVTCSENPDRRVDPKY